MLYAQVLSILNALSAKKESLVFMGNTIKCNHNCGIFITMNPGYAGRTELPDNLKARMEAIDDRTSCIHEKLQTHTFHLQLRLM